MWLRPLSQAQGASRVPHNRPRPVVINGQRYRSLYQACKALGVGYCKVYYLIGEQYRFPTARKLHSGAAAVSSRETP
jgi:hypothetical protein